MIVVGQGPILRMIFHCNPTLKEILFCSLSCNEGNAMEFCIWHDSCVAVIWAKFHTHKRPCYAVKTKTKFPSNLNYNEKIAHEMGPMTKQSRPNSFHRPVGIYRIKFPSNLNYVKRSLVKNDPDFIYRLHNNSGVLNVFFFTKRL